MSRINTMSGGFVGFSSLTSTSKDEPEYLGSTMVFAQAAAPTGWTKQTTHNDCALRIVSGTASNGGSVGFTSAFSPSLTPFSPAAGSWATTIGTTTIDTTMMGGHTHPSTGAFSSVSGNSGYGPAPYRSVYLSQALSTGSMGSTGTGGGHTHSGSITTINLSSSLDMAVKYVDVILARY